MTKETLKARIERHRAWMGDEATLIARNKLFLGEPLTKDESSKLFKYLRKLENSLDNYIES